MCIYVYTPWKQAGAEGDRIASGDFVARHELLRRIEVRNEVNKEM